MLPPAEFKDQPDAQAIFSQIQQGRFEKAAVLADALILREPENALALYLRGLIFRGQNDMNSAISFLNKALRQKPDFKKACNDLAFVLQEAGQLPLAIKAYEHLIKIEQNDASGRPEASKPLSAEAQKTFLEWSAKGQAFYARGQVEQASEVFRKALVLWPDNHDMLVNVSVTLWSLGKHEESESLLLKALRVKPGYTPALNQLGNTFKERRYLSKAIAAYRLAHAGDASYRQPLVNLGKTYFEMQLYAESIEAYDKALKLESDFLEALAEITYLRQMLCRWENLAEAETRIRRVIESGAQPCEPFIAMIYTPAALQLANAQRWSRKLYPGGLPWKKETALPATARADGKLRIGYLSSDFQRHATLALISEIFSHHDRTKFEVYAYSHGVDDGGPERVRVKDSVDAFRDLQVLDDQSACDIIRKDGIDILVDLKGYTQNHRLSLMARRPAPVQMHYLGFPGTLGSPFIDYFIADAVAAPESLDAFFAEKLIRLPQSYQVNDRKRLLPEEGPSREEYGLPEEAFVFCAFNNTYKITPELFSVWMNLLKDKEGSVLWVLEAQAESTVNLKREAEARGIAPSRIIGAKMAPMSKHLMRYRHADLFIDSTPVCGHTTASDALWCGVPVVAVRGESFIGNVAASLLHAVELPELVADNLKDYETLALSLAKDAGRREAIRKHLNEGRIRFSLFDSTRTTRALEAAYLHAGERQREGKAPAAFTLKDDLSVN